MSNGEETAPVRSTALQVIVMFLGSLLLFLIQPIVGQRLSPVWGGSPAVWLTCMMFFQGVLWLGYTWSMVLSKFFSIRWQTIGQAGLLLLATVIVWNMKLVPQPSSSARFPPLDITWYLLLVIGVPTIALATTSPLIQHWMARTYEIPKAVYRWFALSNFASLVALLVYPFVVQPLLSVAGQISTWVIGFSLFAAGFIVIAFSQTLGLKQRRDLAATAVDAGILPRTKPPSPKMFWAWWFLSFSPAVLLMAVTNQLNADLSAGPLLWVLPLGLYLLTFTISFAWPGCINSSGSWWLAAIGAVGLLVGVWFSSVLSAWVLGSLLLGGLFGLSLLAHGCLVRTQPETAWLTSYYWMIATGGWCGGMAVGFVAPLLFSHYYELEFAVLACWWGSLWACSFDRRPQRPATRFIRRLRNAGWILASILITVCCILGWNAKFPWLKRDASENGLLIQTRTFFGVLKVTQRTTPFGTLRTLGHGSTDHGRQLIDGPYAKLPTGYYGPGSGLSLAFQEIRGRQPDKLRVAILGLGAGNIVHWGKRRDEWVFYEIDPQIGQLARDYFRNLNDTPATCSVRFVDARIGLQQDATKQSNWDLLVMDAFTGDAVPAHLLTEEAWQVYLDVLNSNGVVAVHVSNRYIDLRPVLASIAEKHHLHAWLINHSPAPLDTNRLKPRTTIRESIQGIMDHATLVPGSLISMQTLLDVDPRKSDWVLLSRQPFQTENWVGISAQKIEDAVGTARWTDDFAPLVPILKW